MRFQLIGGNKQTVLKLRVKICVVEIALNGCPCADMLVPDAAFMKIAHPTVIADCRKQRQRVNSSTIFVD